MLNHHQKSSSESRSIIYYYCCCCYYYPSPPPCVFLTMPISAFDAFGRSHRSRFVAWLQFFFLQHSYIHAWSVDAYSSGYGSATCQGFENLRGNSFNVHDFRVKYFKANYLVIWFGSIFRAFIWCCWFVWNRAAWVCLPSIVRWIAVLGRKLLKTKKKLDKYWIHRRHMIYAQNRLKRRHSGNAPRKKCN